MDDVRRARLAENECICRIVNERLAEGHAEFALQDEQEFLCECADVGCLTRLRLTLAEYERVRSNPYRFVIAPGHEEPDAEEIVENLGRYAVVEKVGAGAAVAERRARER